MIKMNSVQLITFLGLFLVLYIHSGDALNCYVCNTHFDKDKCEDGQVDESFLTNCDDLAAQTNLEYTMCRKQDQNIEGKKRTIRDCAVSGKEECGRRTGTKEISLVYCECKGDGCNSANTLNPFLSIVVGILTLFFSLVR